MLRGWEIDDHISNIPRSSLVAHIFGAGKSGGKHMVNTGSRHEKVENN